jgi:hypothetical protein
MVPQSLQISATRRGLQIQLYSHRKKPIKSWEAAHTSVPPSATVVLYVGVSDENRRTGHVRVASSKKELVRGSGRLPTGSGPTPPASAVIPAVSSVKTIALMTSAARVDPRTLIASKIYRPRNEACFGSNRVVNFARRRSTGKGRPCHASVRLDRGARTKEGRVGRVGLASPYPRCGHCDSGRCPAA